MIINANGDAERYSRFGLDVIADGIQGFPVRLPVYWRQWTGRL